MGFLLGCSESRTPTNDFSSTNSDFVPAESQHKHTTTQAEISKDLPVEDPFDQAADFLALGQYASAALVLQNHGFDKLEPYRAAIDRVFQDILHSRAPDSERWQKNVQTATIAFAMIGEHNTANSISTLLEDRTARIRRIADLRTMSSLAPSDRSIAEEILRTEDLKVPFEAIRIMAKHNQGSGTDSNTGESLLDPGHQLFRQLCGHCHGQNGDGQGVASRYLFPPPRNLRTESLKYISSISGIGTEADVRQTVVEGLRGTSMPSFRQLSEREVEMLVQQVLKFQGFVRSKSESVQSNISTHPAPVQDWTIATSDDLSEGREQFKSLGCVQCHSDTYSKSNRIFIDRLGRTVSARNLFTEPLRRGSELHEIYLRIVCGIPGSPHPQTVTTSGMDLRPLVHYVQSLLPANYPATTNYARR